MSFKLKPTSNNPNPIEFKKEIEILEETTSFGQYNNNNYPIPFKKEQTDANNTNTVDYHYHSNNYERIKNLESKIIDLNEIIEAQSNEISDLKLRLNEYEPISNRQMNERSENNQTEETMFNLEIESNHLMPSYESDNDSDQTVDETSNKVINIISSLNIYK
jgi:predicted RNase H-like nuclease (RuvC/YqgF family)